MAQCLVTFAVISPIEPSSPITVDGIMDPGLPPHTPYLGTPVVFPPGQRPVSFCFWRHFALDNRIIFRYLLVNEKYFFTNRALYANGKQSERWHVRQIRNVVKIFYARHGKYSSNAALAKRGYPILLNGQESYPARSTFTSNRRKLWFARWLTAYAGRPFRAFSQFLGTSGEEMTSFNSYEHYFPRLSMTLICSGLLS